VPYEQTDEWPLAEGVALRFSRSGRPIERYAVILLIYVDGVWREVRLFDNHMGAHHMHRYTPNQGKQEPETFHPGPINVAMAAAIEHLKAHWEAIIQPWQI